VGGLGGVRGSTGARLALLAAIWGSSFLWIKGAAGAPGPRLGATVAISIAILGLLGTGIAYVLNYQIITSAGATSASTVTYLLPVVAIILGVAVLGEHVSVLTLAGIALILAGVAVTRRRGVAAGQGQPRAAGRAGPAG
jgi:drug/metabolite transporter (DMT)-like permease